MLVKPNENASAECFVLRALSLRYLAMPLGIQISVPDLLVEERGKTEQIYQCKANVKVV